MSKPHLDRNDEVGNMVMDSLETGFKTVSRQGIRPWFIPLGLIWADAAHGAERLERMIHNTRMFLSELTAGETPVIVLEDIPVARFSEAMALFAPLLDSHPRLRFVCFSAP